ncbi:2-dehydropantoate 2-reductase [Rouxiella badensis]|uniref:ketopantoate reductase family protein n=1 Tax=Rouxiella badensis TaxID=1646377 RepID=UPI001D13350A|nr:2-dehydropantoate 2-reductase [Rouxiella badensis]MCC3703793.1 2-dehydropantoate 2-reductase [Rouxiella badensis]MCC3719821.1 2-dehydropantoate 2-reductase [Rouxiella badensis]MCC3729327.1 2-dehydropantoate 2-reductase [Rouxiella badensis]MCC3734743.1 2-dehydropantoate 2-reductase [Rouxiella badensis]MCC3741494.1 2-dehydropantoate 2-reductase [Rouxiella badensis]
MSVATQLEEESYPEQPQALAPLVIWGAGAIGGAIGASFIEAGQPVIFVDNVAEHVAAINLHGLRITGPMGDKTVHAQAFLPEQLEGLHCGVLLAVKSHHTAAAIHQIAPLLAPEGYVVSMQNGLNERVIADVIGAERTVGAFLNFGADFLEPGVIHHGGRGAVVIGELDGITRPRTEALYRLLQHFDPAAVLTPNIWGFLWAKMIYGALLFATALTDDSIADVLAMPRFRPVLTQLAREIGAVAHAQNILLEGFDGFDPSAFLPNATPEHTQQSFDDMVAHNRRSAKSHSGIWRDLAVRKRQTEIDAQIAPAIDIGIGFNLPMPLTTRLVQLIHRVERGELPQAFETLARLELHETGTP